MKVMPNGNIALTVELMPEAYAAMMATAERDKLSNADAVNVALMTLDHISKTAADAGKPLSEATVVAE